MLCRDMITPSQIPNTLTHELIHAYDHCRGKGFSLTNCEHHACTEVRSLSSSGCASTKAFRGQLAGQRGIRLQIGVCARDVYMPCSARSTRWLCFIDGPQRGVRV